MGLVAWLDQRSHSRLGESASWIYGPDRIEGRPEYLRLTFLTYIFGLFYERIVNASDRLARWRILLIAELRKPNI
jgi:hypothetical protein